MLQKVKQTEQTLQEQSQIQNKELENWKNNCDNLNSTISRKYAEIEQLMNKVQELDEQVRTQTMLYDNQIHIFFSIV